MPKHDVQSYGVHFAGFDKNVGTEFVADEVIFQNL